MNGFGSQAYEYGDVHLYPSAIVIPSLLDIERVAIVDPDVRAGPRLGDTWFWQISHQVFYWIGSATTDAPLDGASYLASAVDWPVALSNRI